MKSYKHKRLLSGRLLLAAFAMFLSVHARAQQGYAVLSADGKTLTFYYGTPTGTYYNTDNTGTESPGWLWKRSSITKVVFDSSFRSARPSSCYKWFDAPGLTTITGIQYFNTSMVTNMEQMFSSSNLKSLDLSHFDTSNVTNMRSMFSVCHALTSLDVSHFDTSKVTNMGHMFWGSSGLTSLDVSGFDTSKVTDMRGMFRSCYGLTSLDVSNFDTSNVTDMELMFYSCSGMTSLDLSHFDTSKVTDMHTMFEGCYGLTSLDVSGFDTSKVTDMSHMFYGCSGLTSLDLSHFDTSKVTDMGHMFYGCSGLTSLDVSGFDTSNVTDMGHMFYGCSGLTSLTFGQKFNIAKVTDKKYVFNGCSKLRYLDFYASNHTNAITRVGFMTDENNMFYGIPATSVIYLPHGSKEVYYKQNFVYSYGGDETDLRCPKYYSEDKVDIELPRDFKTNEAVYKRTMSKSYGSVVLPYDFTTNSNIQAYTLNEERTDNMFFKNTQTVAAHTPFAFKKLASGTEADFTMTNNSFGITVKATRSTNAAEDTWTGTKGSPYTADANLGGWTTKGYYVAETVNDYSDAYYIASDKFYKADGALTMYPHRVTFHGAWTKGTGNAKFFDIETGDDELITAIEAAETEQTLRDAAGIYDASGRRQTAVRKGLNIVRMSDGTVKKVIVK